MTYEEHKISKLYNQYFVRPKYVKFSKRIRCFKFLKRTHMPNQKKTFNSKKLTTEKYMTTILLNNSSLTVSYNKLQNQKEKRIPNCHITTLQKLIP